MSNNQSPTPGQSYSIGSAYDFRQYLRAVFSYMAGGLALTGAVAFASVMSGIYQQIAGTPLMWVVLLAPLGLVILLSARVQSMSVAAVQLTYWVYSALMGLSLAGIFLVYTGQSIFQVFFITAATFGVMSLYGYTTKADLSNWGSFLFMGLIGVIIASVVNIFLHSSELQWIVSICGVIVFTGLTAYDVNKIKALAGMGEYDDQARKGAIMGALSLYLDFVNLFLLLLRLMGNRR